MKRLAMTPFAAVAVILLASASHAQNQPGDPRPGALGSAASVDGGSASTSMAARLQQFLVAKPGARLMHSNGQIQRVYGPALSNGPTALASADAFRRANAGLFGVAANELVASSPAAGAPHVQQLMFNRAAGTYKFSAVYYAQTKAGIPVFGARLVLLARNEPTYPVVLASTTLRDLGQFNLAGPVGRPNAAAALPPVAKLVGPNPRFSPPQFVIWAGVDDVVAVPTLATQFVVESGRQGASDHRKLLVIADAATGNVLHTESLIYHGDVAGEVSGLATEGLGADTCGPESAMGLPYIEVFADETSVFADVKGAFTLPVSGSGSVLLSAGLRGRYFDVFAQQGVDRVLSSSAAAPGPAAFLFNPDNLEEFDRAQVNGYLHANVVRDFVLSVNPDYPVIGTQVDFPVNVNIDATCNASYDGTAINFRNAGDGCPNTANSTVVYHEYGHHLVQVGGSGQGAYGEGMSDCTAVLVTDQPWLGPGFHGDCGEPLRNADNDMQYPCSGGIHLCGQLISGCIWSTRNELLATNPSTYRAILSDLTLNSIMLHTGTSINPSITVDFLTLDDDDEDISNGTPHYNEIAAGFGAHNMDAPPLAALSISFPNGRPSYVAPIGGTTVRFVVNGVTQLPQAGSGLMTVSVDGGPFTSATVIQVSPNTYDGVFPASACGSSLRYFFTALSTTGTTATSPAGAPAAATYAAISAAGADSPVFDDNGETDMGWTVTDSSDLDDGTWDRGVPKGGGDRGDPPVDADGSGACWLTANQDGDSDIDGGTTTLTSPLMDASRGEHIISYYRWYSNTQGSDPEQDTFVVEVSSNGGTNWVSLETVGPDGPEVDGGWFFKEFNVSEFVALTSQFRIRFRASDLRGGSIVEAGIDGVKLTPLICTAVFGDLNLDGHVNGLDLAILLGQWTGAATIPGCPPAPAADLNGDCRVNGLDLGALLGAWTG